MSENLFTKQEAIGFARAQARENGQRHRDYWKAAGSIYLDPAGKGPEWRKFVDDLVDDPYDNGIHVNETLQIVAMINTGVPTKEIAKAFRLLPGIDTILDAYLPQFIDKGTIAEIKEHILNANKRIQ